MGDGATRDNTWFQQDGGTFDHAFREQHIQSAKNNHIPVTDISIIVPFVTFSNSLSKLISKSMSPNLSSQTGVEIC